MKSILCPSINQQLMRNSQWIMFYFTDIYFALQYCLMTTDHCFYKIVHWHYIREIMIIARYGMPINTSDSIIWDNMILQATSQKQFMSFSS